ncbi:MAG: hypothetical protein RLW61_04240 [Gammaproteobacteria bacterium]
MSRFHALLTASSEELLKMLYRSAAATRDASPGSGNAARPQQLARHLGLTYAQLVCALGFNHAIVDLADVVAIAGFESYDALARERNLAFTTDIYQKLGVRDVLAIYLHVPANLPMLEVMQHLMQRRLENIEAQIEATVNSICIERYKKEMRAIYNDGVAQIDFAEQRLSQTHSGFRALLNEVVLIVESRLIPVGDIFFRDTILPEEKRRLIIRGLIPRELVEARLADHDIPSQERRVLEDQLRLMQA